MEVVYHSGIARTHFQLLSYVFRRNSVLFGRRTALPTLLYYCTRKPLPPSDKPALFTMNILPPMMTVWYHCARKYLGDAVDIVIFDCTGLLDPREFPGARVQKFLNFYASTKSDEFLNHVSQHRRIGWICDDDVFFRSSQALEIVKREFAVPGTASVSFRNRTWWHFEIEGKEHTPSGSYCIAFDRSILIDKEHLSLAPAEGNTHPSHLGKKERRYDTADRANEMLLRKGYRCFIVPRAEQNTYVAGFSGLSGAVMLLHYFKKPEDVLSYFTTPDKRYWSGNVLFGTLAGMLAISTIQECYTQIKGRSYPLPSLPSRNDLEKLRREHEHLLRPDQSFTWIDEVSELLRTAI